MVRKGDFQMIAWLIETKLNGIKYFYAGQFLSLVDTLQSTFNLDFKNDKDNQIAFESVKMAIEIYFVPENSETEEIILPSAKDWWMNLKANDMQITWSEPNNWHKVGFYGYGWKETAKFKERILFHISKRLAIEE